MCGVSRGSSADGLTLSQRIEKQKFASSQAERTGPNYTADDEEMCVTRQELRDMSEEDQAKFRAIEKRREKDGVEKSKRDLAEGNGKMPGNVAVAA